jgi:hypothetical protein
VGTVTMVEGRLEMEETKVVDATAAVRQQMSV